MTKNDPRLRLELEGRFGDEVAGRSVDIFGVAETTVDDLVPGDGTSDFREKRHQHLGLPASLGFGQLQKY